MAIDELAPGSSHERQARAAAWAGGAGSGGRGGARPQGERMTILGIDPGKSGAVAVLDEGGELLKVRHALADRRAGPLGAALALIDAYQAQHKDSQQTGADR
jgi:hypothetical protein